MQQRIYWVDYAKFIGIFLVVLGHTSVGESAVNFIYAFHMPLFFFISGYLFDFSKFDSLQEFIKHRLKQLILPYFFFSAITYLFWLFIGRKFGNDSSLDISIFTPLIGFIYGTDTNNYLIHCGSLWFIPCLFLVEIIYYYFYGKMNVILLTSVFIVIASVNLKFKHVLLPLSFDAALSAILFYIIGNQIKSKNVVNKIFGGLKGGILIFVSLILLIVLSKYNGRSDMGSNTYNNFFLFLIIALIGIYFTYAISYAIGNVIRSNSIIEFYSKNTIIILALHDLIASILKGIMHFVFRVPVDIFKQTLFLNCLLSIGIFVALTPIILIINKYLPFILGRNKLVLKS